MSESRYNPEFLHYDNLIWQVPTWCTAVLVIAVDAVDRSTSLVQATGLTKSLVLAYFFGLMAFFVGVLDFVLYRFRVHQRLLAMFPEDRAFWQSAQFYLQLLVTVEFTALVALILLILRFPGARVLCISFALVAVLTLLSQNFLKRYERGSSAVR